VTDPLTQARELTVQAEVLIEAEAAQMTDVESLTRVVDALRLAIGALTVAIEERAAASEPVH
jgi:hypothetical protein